MECCSIVLEYNATRACSRLACVCMLQRLGPVDEVYKHIEKLTNLLHVPCSDLKHLTFTPQLEICTTCIVTDGSLFSFSLNYSSISRLNICITPRPLRCIFCLFGRDFILIFFRSMC